VTPVVHFSRRYRISASHRLHVGTMSDAENYATFGKCNNPFGHGHNYVLEVTVAGPVDADTGMVVDMVALDSLVKEQIVERFDQTHLNVDPLFSGELVPSTENFVIEVEKILQKSADALRVRLVRVRMEETSNNSFDLLPDESRERVTF
jgi:6-pyruvoyltetrahydropterin/6-carboxytetrahydropterin synthase